MSKLFEHVLSYSRMFISMISKHERSLYICCHCSITSKSFVSLPGYKEITASPINPGSILKGYANAIVSENSVFFGKSQSCAAVLDSFTGVSYNWLSAVFSEGDSIFWSSLCKTGREANHVPLQVCAYRITEGCVRVSQVRLSLNAVCH